MRWIYILIFICIGAFCVWGANAGNPDNDLSVTLIYSIGFLTCLVWIYSLLPGGE